MKVSFADRRPAGAHALALPVAAAAPLDDALAGLTDGEMLRRAATGARFTAESASIVEAWLPDGEGARRVLLAGLGAVTDPERGNFDRVGGALAARLLTSGETMLVVDVGHLPGDRAQAAARLAFGAVLRAWRHDVYRTTMKPAQKPTLAEIVVVGAGEGGEGAWTPLEKIADGVAFTRTLVAEPANVLYPESFVERARALAALGVTVEALDEAEMRELGMGALLGVSLGSAREARLLVMRYDGSGGTREPVALVGKGVTFDTGGISLKPPAGMEDMKWDMGGAGAVTGAMMAIAGRKSGANVVAVCALVENMPDGLAQRPGDVVTSMSGQTIEVINTDAEGRLVLCDALTWVQRTHAVKTIVDLATLTGAMIVSLGHERGGLFANDDALAQQLGDAGAAVGEKLWRMPLGEEYDKLIDSPIADMKNVGPREAGSISAAQFLKRYIGEGVRWAHLDIAGMVWAAKAGPLFEKGATGYGVRLLDRFVADNFEG